MKKTMNVTETWKYKELTRADVEKFLTDSNAPQDAKFRVYSGTGRSGEGFIIELSMYWDAE